jgi:hypothetical protein
MVQGAVQKSKSREKPAKVTAGKIYHESAKLRKHEKIN